MAAKKRTRPEPKGTQEKDGARRGMVAYHWADDAFAPLDTNSPAIEAREESAPYGASVGLRLNGPDAVILRLKKGLPVSSFEHLCRAIDIPASRLAKVTNIPLRTLARRKREGRFPLAESERIYRLGLLLEKAVETLGSVAAARRWLIGPRKALGGKSPLEYADTEVGAREVEDLLGRLEYGVFA